MKNKGAFVHRDRAPLLYEKSDRIFKMETTESGGRT